MAATRFEFDPGEVERYLKPLEPRDELVYRMAILSLCDRCRGDSGFRRRLTQLQTRFAGELGDILVEAGRLREELVRGH